MSTVTETEYTRTEDMDSTAPESTTRVVKKTSGLGGKIGMIMLALLGLVALFAIYAMFIAKPSQPQQPAPAAQAPANAAPTANAATPPGTQPATTPADPNAAGNTLPGTVPADPNAAPADLLGATGPQDPLAQASDPNAAPIDPNAALGGAPTQPGPAGTVPEGATDPLNAAATPLPGTTPATPAPAPGANTIPGGAPAPSATPSAPQSTAEPADPDAVLAGATSTPVASGDVFEQFRSMLDPIDARVKTLERRVDDLSGAVNEIRATLANNPQAAARVRSTPSVPKARSASAKKPVDKKLRRVVTVVPARSQPRNQLQVLGNDRPTSYAVKVPVQPPVSRVVIVEQPQQVAIATPAVVEAPRAVVAPSQTVRMGCNLQSIQPGRAWVGLPGGDIAEYSVGNGWTNGARIVEIDPSRGIITEGGVVVCR